MRLETLIAHLDDVGGFRPTVRKGKTLSHPYLAFAWVGARPLAYRSPRVRPRFAAFPAFMTYGIALGPQMNPPVAEATEPEARRFVLSPRCSLTARTARIFIGIVATTTFSVALFFTWQGFWPVLPFAGLEIALLIWAVRASMRKGQERETITITADSVTVQHYTVDGEWHSVFPRHWAKVKLHTPLTAVHPSRLTLELHGRVCEVGRFLTEDERRSLAVRLKQLVGNVNESPALR